MKIDNGYFYNIEPVLDIYHFAELFLVTLIDNNYYHQHKKEKNKKVTIKLPTNYKDSIEKAMYSTEAILFHQLINSYEYYEEQTKWELLLADTINKYLKDKNKTISYNFEFDFIEIPFTIQEIEEILKKYDKTTINIMKNFIIYIEITGIKRYNTLSNNEERRKITREYIKISNTKLINTWSYENSNKNEKKNVNFYINSNYLTEETNIKNRRKDKKCIKKKIKL